MIHPSFHSPYNVGVDVRVRKALVVLSRFVLIGWASVWIAALPLFHTHLPSVLQQPVGLPHTIFSPDLPGEYLAFGQKTTTDEFELSVLVSNSPELGFVASLEDGKRKSLPQPGTILLLSLGPPILLASQRIQELPLMDPTTRWSPESHGFRAPPLPVS